MPGRRRVGKQALENQRMVNALREIMGKAPLYGVAPRGRADWRTWLCEPAARYRDLYEGGLKRSGKDSAIL